MLIPVWLVLFASAADAQEDYDTELNLGIEAFYADRLVEAVERWEKCLELRPQTAECARRLAMAHGRSGRVDAALDALAEYVEWGGAEWHRVESNTDLEGLRNDPRYKDVRTGLLANFEQANRDRRVQALAQRAALRASSELVEDSPIVWRDGHCAVVVNASISPDDERVVTVGQDAVLLWDSWTGEGLGRLGTHRAAPAQAGAFAASVMTARFSPDGETILLVDPLALSVGLWDGGGGDALWPLHEDEELVLSADYLPDGRVVTTDEEGVLRIWDSHTGKLESKAEAEVLIVFLAARPDGTLLTLDDAGHCQVLDPETGQVLRALGTDLDVHACDALADGRMLAVCDDGATRLWPKGNGIPLVYPGRPGLGRPVGLERTMQLSPDGSRLYTLDGLGERLWDSRSVTPIATIREGRHSVGSQTWTADGNLVIAHGNASCIVTESRGFDGLRFGLWRSGTSVQFLGSFVDGRLLLCNHQGAYVIGEGASFVALQSHAPVVLGLGHGSGGRVFNGLWGISPLQGKTLGNRDPYAPPIALHTARFWDLATGLALSSLDSSGKDAYEALFLQDGRVLIAGNGGCLIVGSEFEPRGTISAIAKGAVLSPDESRLACMFSNGEKQYSALCSTDGLHIRDFGDLSETGLQADSPVPVFALGEGALIVTAHRDNSLQVWDGFDGEPVTELLGHTKNVRHMAMAPNGEVLVSCGLDGVARLWDMKRMNEAHVLRTTDAWLWHGAFSPDSKLIAAGGESGRIHIWLARSGQRLHEFPGHAGAVRWVGFHPDGRLLLTCGDDGVARLWNVADGSLRSELLGHQAAIREAVFAEDGSRILTLGLDSTTRVWEVPSGRLLGTHVEYADRGWLTFTPEGYYVAGGQAAEWARIRVHGDTYPLSSYALALDRPDLVEKSLAGEHVAPPTLLSAPEVALWVAPNGVVNVRQVHVEGDAKSNHGIEVVRVTVEGRLKTGESAAAYPIDPKVVDQRGGRVVFALTVRIPDGWSEIEIRVQALSGRGVWSKVATMHRRYEAPPEAPSSRLFLLALGVQDYDDDGLDLKYARKDVEDVVAVFEELGKDLFTEVRTEKLLDGQVNRAEINRMRHEFLYDAGPEDTIVIYIAGHGVLLRDEYYFLTPGDTPSNPYGGLTKDDLHKLVKWEGLESRRRLMLIDTCHAGESYGGSRAGVSLQDVFTKEELRKNAGEGLYIVTASTEAGMAAEVDGNGLFTRVLLEALRGAADEDGDGEVDTAELIFFVTEQVKARGKQRVTTPLTEGGVPFPLTRVKGR